MLATQGLVPTVAGRIRPACPNCGRSMHLSRITAATDALPDLRTFRCGECGVWLTEAADDGLVD
jgi:hypothetical protein